MSVRAGPSAGFLSLVRRVYDPWVPNTGVLSQSIEPRDLGQQDFALAVVRGNLDHAHNLISLRLQRNPALVKNIDRGILSVFLSALPSGAHTAHEYWPWAQEVRNAMQKASIKPTLHEYGYLLNLSFKSKDLDGVETLWDELQGVQKDTNVWNHYIQATCRAYPTFWPWSPAKAETEPPALNNVRELLVRMVNEGVVANSRTFELFLLALARAGDLTAASEVADRVWLSPRTPLLPDSLLWPQHHTLTAFVDAFAFNNELQSGLALTKRVQKQYAINLGVKQAHKYWSRVLRLVRVQTEPRGKLGSTLFDEVWQDMTSTHKFSPGLSHYTIRFEFLEWKNQFDQMLGELRPFMERNDSRASQQFGRGVLERAARGLVNTSRGLDAIAALDEWAHRGIDVRVQMQDYIQHKCGLTRDQLAQDDDEEGIWGF